MNDEKTHEETGEIPQAEETEYKSPEAKRESGVFQPGKKGTARGESAVRKGARR